MDWTKITLMVIAGGKSSRMGRDKRWLEMEGETFLERILKKGRTQGVAEILLCVEEQRPMLRRLAERYGARLLTDEVRGAGPVAGLVQGLSHMRTDWGLTAATDMPFFDFQPLEQLEPYLSGKARVVIPFAMGRRNPLAAFYHRSMAEAFGRALATGQRKIGVTTDQAPHELVEIAGAAASFFNVNTLADLRLARGRLANLSRRVPVISVTAPASGTGKTTFIERLLPRLQSRGIRVGVLKSDSHGFNLDVEGKDSWRFQQAGAQSVAVVAPGGWMLVQKTEKRADFAAVAQKMDAVDLVLTESRTHGAVPALSLWRGKGTPMQGEDVAAQFREGAMESRELYQYDLNDLDRATELCLFLMGR